MHVQLPSGIRIEFEDRGPVDAPAVVLIMGLGMQLTAWPPAFIDGLLARGLRVLRFDNRDAGLSGRVTDAAPVDLRAAALRAVIGLKVRAPYGLDDMAADTLGLMSARGIRRAHVVGVSMGGMVAQVLASGWPQRVLSLTCAMTSSGAPRFNLHVSPATRALLRQPPPRATEAQRLEHLERIWRLIGSPGLQPSAEALRERLRLALQRAPYDPTAIGRQLLAILESGDRRPLLRRIRVPTLVLHGDRDPLVPLAAGRDIAANVPGAILRVIEGMAHDLPEALLPRLVGEIAAHVERAGALAT
jgi:pimeloyl-ACP methyl ester carboxylesterase